jgi:hypothetical protein
MPTYTFKLQDGDAGLADETGVQLRDREQALQYAHSVIHELANRREAQTRLWQLDVYENKQPIFEIPFASLDPSLDHLNPAYRTIVEDAYDKQRSLRSALHAAQVTIQESRALVARSRGKPYLASRFGRSIIRD